MVQMLTIGAVLVTIVLDRMHGSDYIPCPNATWVRFPQGGESHLHWLW